MFTYITALYFAIPIFLILILVEIAVAYKKGITINRSADMISSLSSGITNTTRDGIKFGFLIISYSWLVDHITIINLTPVWLAVVVAFVTVDFAGYWVHRMNHRINVFWNRHVIHHSSEEYNLSCALRQSISDNIQFGAIFLIPAALLGVPPVLFAVISPIQLFMQFWYHTQLIDKMGWLEKILVTPSHHRVHHAINKEYIDKNYSQIFIIWDKLFGSFQPELTNVKPVYGILRPAQTWNPIFINFKHIWQIVKDAYHTQNLWDKFRIWFMPTGWRPEDVAENFPIRTIEDPYKQKKYSTDNSPMLLAWSWFQLIMTLGFMFLLFSKLAYLNQTTILIYTAFIILTVSSYTLLLDGKKYVIIFEGLKCIIGIGLILFLSTLISEFMQISLFVYLLFSLGLTIYFYNFENLRLSKISMDKH